MSTEKKLEDLSWDELLEATSRKQERIDDLLSNSNTETRMKGVQTQISNELGMFNKETRKEMGWDRKGGIVVGNKNKEQFKKIASKYAVENSLKSRWKLQKKVYEYDLDGNFLREFKGANIARKELGYCIGAVLRGKRKTAHGKFYTYEKKH